MLQISVNLKSIPADARKFLVHAAFTRVKACICTYGKEPKVSFVVEDFTIALSVWWRYFCALSRATTAEIDDISVCIRMHYKMQVKSLSSGREQTIKVYLSQGEDGMNYGLED